MNTLSRRPFIVRLRSLPCPSQIGAHSNIYIYIQLLLAVAGLVIRLGNGAGYRIKNYNRAFPALRALSLKGIPPAGGHPLGI